MNWITFSVLAIVFVVGYMMIDEAIKKHGDIKSYFGSIKE